MSENLAKMGAAQPLPRTSGLSFFQWMGVLAIAAALTGFMGTFFVPMAQGRFAAPPIVHLHGAAAFSWLFLFLTQASLARLGHYRVHKLLGAAALLLAPALAATGIAVGVYATGRDLAAGGGETAVSALLGTCTSMTIFLALVVSGLAMRKHGEVHKRLMLLATIVVLWPAWFRFRHYFPGVPRPDIVFGVVLADSLIGIGMLRDKLVLKRVHPLYLWVGCAIVIENLTEVALFDTPPWRALSHIIYSALS